MRDVPQLKLVREDQGWSQRTLAARSGVAQNTISQLERGERQAMPSTVRKLADALGVDPPVLMAQASRKVQEQEEQPSGTLKLLSELHMEEARASKEWYETGRWAEYYVSGEFANWARAFAEAHDMASILSEGWGGSLVDFLSDPEQQFLENIGTALHSHVGDLPAVRARLISDDPKETVLAAQLVLDRAKRILEEHEGYLQSFRRIPERYYAYPEAHLRIVKFEEALSKQREAAAEDIRKLKDLYDESLEMLEDQILGMRRESDVLEEFVMRAHDWER